MKNLWPTIDDVKETNDIFPFLDTTVESLKQSYGGKLKAQYCQIEYILKGVRSMASAFADISQAFSAVDEENKYVEKEDVEKGRDAARVIVKNYKYEIFNDHLYYKIFTIQVPEFYPINVHVSAGILDKNDKEEEIYSLDSLSALFSKIVSSSKVKMIISKMIMSNSSEREKK